MSLFIVLLEGVLSYNPPVRKSAFQPFDHFLIQPPPPLRCNIECSIVRYSSGLMISRTSLILGASQSNGNCIFAGVYIFLFCDRRWLVNRLFSVDLGVLDIQVGGEQC